MLSTSTSILRWMNRSIQSLALLREGGSEEFLATDYPDLADFNPFNPRNPWLKNSFRTFGRHTTGLHIDSRSSVRRNRTPDQGHEEGSAGGMHSHTTVALLFAAAAAAGRRQ